MTVHTMPDRSSFRGQVAGEARAEMARQKYTINQLPHLLGKSQSYWSRRLNGDQPMDVDDLAALARLLNVPVTRFFEAPPGSPFESLGGSLTGGYGAYVPTHPAVWELAQTRPRIGWWFPSRSGTGHVTSLAVSTMTTKLFAAHGIEGSIHRCRHTYATQLLRAGENIRVVQELMRHQSLSSTQIYTLVDGDERRDAIRLLVAA